MLEKVNRDSVAVYRVEAGIMENQVEKKTGRKNAEAVFGILVQNTIAHIMCGFFVVP